MIPKHLISNICWIHTKSSLYNIFHKASCFTAYYFSLHSSPLPLSISLSFPLSLYLSPLLLSLLLSFLLFYQFIYLSFYHLLSLFKSISISSHAPPHPTPPPPFSFPYLLVHLYLYSDYYPSLHLTFTTQNFHPLVYPHHPSKYTPPHTHTHTN